MGLGLVGGEHGDARLGLDQRDGLVEQVGPERVGSDGQHHVVTGERVVHDPALPGQMAREQRVILGEADGAAERLLPDRTAEALGERDDGVPAFLALADRADDKSRRVGTGEQVGELGHPRRLHRVRAENPCRRAGRQLVGGLEPVAHRDHEKRRAHR